MLHVTNIKFQRMLPKTPCVIYFWKTYAKSRSMVMIKNVTCHICYMSHITYVTCHKYKVEKILPKTPCVISFWKAPAKSRSMVTKTTNTKSTPKGPIGNIKYKI